MTRAILVALLLAPAGLTAQRPDFSGTWVRVVDSASARPSVAAVGDAAFQRGDMGSGWGSPLTITQRADSLIVEYVFFAPYDLQPPVRLAYAIDGSESRNDLMIGHATAAQRGRLSWAPSGVVVTSMHAGPDNAPIEMRQTLTLEAGALVIMTERAGMQGSAPTSTRVVYARRAP
jgi:hypothetical protein